MGLIKTLALRLRPPRLHDPVFGPLLFMYIPRNPDRSYWEGEWLFPPTKTKVAIGLPGTVEGPSESGRVFYLALPERFDEIIVKVRPALEPVFNEWLRRPLSANMWQDVTLSGFGIEDPDAVPTVWDVAFETTGEKWLGITVPFVGDAPQQPVVDT